MIKARATAGDGKPVYIVGLSHMNLEKLKEGQPIAFELSELDGHGHLMIFSGETEQTMKEEFSSMIGGSTVVKDQT